MSHPPPYTDRQKLKINIMKTTPRIGKIARLPHAIREQLNLKLLDGVPAKSILPWLNSLPEAKAILAADFENRPINKQNLSEWKQGGHRDWLLQYNASNFLQFVDPCSRRCEEAETPPSEQPSSDHPSDFSNSFTQHAPRNTNDQPHDTHDTHGIHVINKLLLWTQLQYIAMARHIDAEPDPDRKWSALRHFANDISRLRRSTLADDYLQIQRDWLALSQSNSTEKKELEFCKWIKRPDIADAIKNKRRGITREEWRKIEEEDLYLLGPDNDALDEHIAQVRLAKELMARRKAKEAEANKEGSAARAASGEPGASTLPDIRLHGMPFEELFPTIPDKPLTELDAAPSDPSDPSDSSDQSNPVKPSQSQSNQINPTPPPLTPI
jgi:hypothetical protein